MSTAMLHHVCPVVKNSQSHAVGITKQYRLYRDL